MPSACIGLCGAHQADLLGTLCENCVILEKKSQTNMLLGSIANIEKLKWQANDIDASVLGEGGKMKLSLVLKLLSRQN